MNMDICYLANAASVHALRWASYFAESGWKVDLITWRPPVKGFKISPNVSVHRILFPPHYIARYGALLEIIRLIGKIHPDIIHAHYMGHFGILAGLYGRLTGFRPIVLTAWGARELKLAGLLGRYLIKYSLKRVDCITCDGENMKEILINAGADQKKIKRMIYEILEVPPKIRFEYQENKKFAVCLTHDIDDIYPALSHTLLSSLHYMQNLNFNDSKISFLGTLKEKNSALTGILKKERLDKGGVNINKFSAQ